MVVEVPCHGLCLVEELNNFHDLTLGEGGFQLNTCKL